MQRQYNFAATATSEGKTVLFYNRAVAGDTVRHINAKSFARRVKLIGDVLYVDGRAAKGWTICVKP